MKIDLDSIFQETVNASLAGLKKLDLEVIDLKAVDGDFYVECRLPSPERSGVDMIRINVSNIVREVIFRDRDQPWLGVDTKIIPPSGLRDRMQSVIAHRMAALESMVEPDEREQRRRLEALGRSSGRLRVYKIDQDG
ncbi:MAG: hypothetical protein H8E35_07770, partial [Ardenticatenia bacterium]|nr:hypothetical protein [Ardenticatenia bacterium]